MCDLVTSGGTTPKKQVNNVQFPYFLCVFFITNVRTNLISWIIYVISKTIHNANWTNPIKESLPFLLQGIKKQSFTYEKRFQIFWHFDKWKNNNTNESKWSFSFFCNESSDNK